MSSNQKLAAAARAAYRTLPQRLRTRQVLARVLVATLAVGVALGTSLPAASARPTPAPIRAVSLLPENVGVGVGTLDPVNVTFPQPMDRTSVEAGMAVLPRSDVEVSWSTDRKTLTLTPGTRWRTDARYVISIPASVRLAAGDILGTPRQVSFTTETAPIVDAFELRYVGETSEERIHAKQDATLTAPAATAETPSDTTADVSAATTVTLGFSAPMDKADTEARFVITPAVEGSLSWEGTSLIFTPSVRLEPDSRYSVSVIGAHDIDGNRLGGDVAFSFRTMVGAQVVHVSPAIGARDVTQTSVVLWFSEPMDPATTESALTVKDARGGTAVAGTVAWNEANTQLTLTFNSALPRGHSYQVTLDDAARDADGNAVTISYGFATPPVPRPAVRTTPRAVAGTPAPADILQYALWQVNQDRARYGFGPLILDSAINAVAASHAQDQITYGYFSHTGRDGLRLSDRLRRAGISFSWSGENMCYYNGLGLKAMLDWCNGVFMAEPYPGYANHIGNILSTHYTRVGVGIARSGGKVIIVWDFAG